MPNVEIRRNWNDHMLVGGGSRRSKVCGGRTLDPLPRSGFASRSLLSLRGNSEKPNLSIRSGCRIRARRFKLSRSIRWVVLEEILP